MRGLAIIFWLVASMSGVQATTFNLINLAGDVKIEVAVLIDGQDEWQDLEAKEFDDGRSGWQYEEDGSWMVEPSFRIKIPSRKADGSLKVDLAQQTIVISFAARALFDPLTIEVPIKLITSVSGDYADRVMMMATPDVYQKVILSAQLMAYYQQVGQLRSRYARNIVIAWFDKVAAAMAISDPEAYLPVRFDTHLMSMLERSVFGEEYDRRFADYLEWQTMFWTTRRDVLPAIKNAERCEMIPLAIEYVRTKHRAMPEAAARRQVTDVPADFAAMQQVYDDCLKSFPGSNPNS